MMLSIVLGCAYNFGHHLKVALRNENKKVINFVTICCNNSLIVPIRNVMTMAKEKDNDTQNIENVKFDTLSENAKNYNLIKKQKIVNTINHIYSIDHINSDQALLLLQSCHNVTDCLPLEKVKLGESLWTVLTICNLNLDTAHYNALLKLYVENEYNFSPLQLLKIMENNNIHADSITYKMCIEYYSMKGNTKSALTLLEVMKRLRLPISESIFNSILLGFSLAGEMKNITKTLIRMKQKKLQLTTETYTAIMCAYAKVNDIDQIRNILEICNLRNMHFTNRDILNVIYILAENNHTAQIDTMYRYLNKKRQILYNEIQVILKLLSINQIHVAVSTLSYMSLNNDHPQCEDILKLILEHMINIRLLFCDILYVSTFFKCERMLKKSLLILIHHSLMKNSTLSLRLLKVSVEKCHCVIKPHYFWPLLINHGNKYNLQGILDTLEIMINDFNVPPCVDTIADYVLPLNFGSVHYIRNLLIKYKVHETIINNAYVLLLLKRRKIRDAASYIQYFQGKYFYKIHAHDLRHASVFTNNIKHFVYISCNLLEDVDLCSTLEANNKLHITFVPIDKQLYEFINDYPYCKSWLRKVMYEIAKQNVRLKLETMETIRTFLDEYTTDNVMSSVQNLSNKEA